MDLRGNRGTVLEQNHGNKGTNTEPNRGGDRGTDADAIRCDGSTGIEPNRGHTGTLFEQPWQISILCWLFCIYDEPNGD
jgi:hypothetical protein